MHTHTHIDSDGSISSANMESSLQCYSSYIKFYCLFFFFFLFLHEFSCLINVRKYVRDAVCLDVYIDDVLVLSVVVLLLVVVVVAVVVMIVAAVVVRMGLHLWMLCCCCFSLSRYLGCVVYVKAENIMSNIIGASVGFQDKHLRERMWRILVAL